jgi:hypothetical protein
MRAFILFLFLMMGCTQEYTVHSIDGFLLRPGDEIEILLTLDTSCSMKGGASTYAAFGIAEAIEDLSTEKIKWDLALTTTDEHDDSFFEIKEGPDADWELISAISKIQESGWSGEAGFGAAMHQYKENTKWFNSGKTLIIFISDEPEQSEYSAQEFLDAWPTDLTTVSITGPAVEDDGEPFRTWGCSGEAAPKYNEASDFHVDICSDTRWSIHDFLTISSE